MKDEYIILNSSCIPSIKIPFELRVLRGYQRPDYSTIGGGNPEFQDWIQRTLATGDRAVLRDSVTFLHLNVQYFDRLSQIGDYFSKEKRIHGRLEEGLCRVKQGLNMLLV